jgi:hypothetical protein
VSDSDPNQYCSVSLRIPSQLKARLKEVAKANERSLNAEILAVLVERYPQSESSTIKQERLLLRLMRRIDDVDKETSGEVRTAQLEALYSMLCEAMCHVDDDAIERLLYGWYGPPEFRQQAFIERAEKRYGSPKNRSGNFRPPQAGTNI